MEPLRKYVTLIHKTFGPADGQIKGYPGHPEIELALLRFYSVTGHRESYELAKYFLYERGNPNGPDGKHYYDWEADRRGEDRWKRPDSYPESRAHWYGQAQSPIWEQETIEGHSVRAMYLLTAVADLVCLSGSAPTQLGPDELYGWVVALKRLWGNMVDKKMYVTGGVGAMKQWEGFGIDYFLPQGTDEGGCYSETCASIGVMMLAERLLHFDLDGHYGDIMELCLYNNVMTAMSVDGKKFTYVNQLGSSDKDKSVRDDWFWCACCPPNLTRLYGSLGGYLWDYGVDRDQAFVNVHLYTSAEVEFEAKPASMVKLRQKSNWPWEGKVMLELVSPPAPLPVTIRLRLPSWSQGEYVLEPPALPGSSRVEKNYLVLDPSYVAQNPTFSIDIKGFETRYLSPHPYSNQNTLAIARGPIVYCAEDVDNKWETNHFKDVVLEPHSPITEVRRKDGATGEEYVELRTRGFRRDVSGARSRFEDADVTRELVFVPYYFRDNRGGNGHMRVGMVNGGMTTGNIFPERGR